MSYLLFDFITDGGRDIGPDRCFFPCTEDHSLGGELFALAHFGLEVKTGSADLVAHFGLAPNVNHGSWWRSGVDGGRAFRGSGRETDSSAGGGATGLESAAITEPTCGALDSGTGGAGLGSMAGAIRLAAVMELTGGLSSGTVESMSAGFPGGPGPIAITESMRSSPSLIQYRLEIRRSSSAIFWDF